MLKHLKPRNLLNGFRFNATMTNVVSNSNSNNNSDSVAIEHKDLLKEKLDDFSKEFSQNRIQLSILQKAVLGFGSSIVALADPRRHDMIAALAETTGEWALQNILQSMNSTNEGQRILQYRPRINTKTIDFNYLSKLPEDTFGFAYAKFLQDNNVTPDSRMEVRFVDDTELAYVMTRYRESHDLVHTVLGMPTNMLGEVAVKWVEALNNGLPMCYGGAVFGAFRLKPKQRKEYVNRYLPWAIQNGKTIKPLMSVFWEERWEQSISDLRKELGITILK